ncbi:MAG: manganese efflux pump MntP family protein [Anaerolineales bacterium]|nr:manganese efflux pump MntP family protein [Anaerolineales bacterium]MDW8226649.1 manganese efflux pump MntP family protein [Anaerolineales bacterium]
MNTLRLTCSMGVLELLFLSLSMATDAFAVCLGAGTGGYISGPRPHFRLAFHFGLFQFIMPVLGWLAGVTIVEHIHLFDHWLAFSLLALVGVRMIRSGLAPNDANTVGDFSRGWQMVLLSIAVSIDALAVGLSLALLEVFVWYPAIVIGVVTGLMSLLGLRIGHCLGKQFGKRMEILGGLVLIGIGVRIVASHMAAG